VDVEPPELPMTDLRRPDRLVVCLSDIEMGAGGVYDDFPHTAFLAELIEAYAGPRFDGLAVEFVFNGDTFDLLKTSVGGVWPTMVTEDVALAKMSQVIDAHGPFFDAVRTFLRRSSPSRVHFVVGNHDQELLFKGVQERIRGRIDAPGVCFPGLSLTLGDAHFEHGSQADRLFRIDPARPFVSTQQGMVLALPWAAAALLDVAMPMQPLFFDLDRLRPRKRVFELLPEVRDHLVGAFWRYWTRDGWREWVGRHPVKRASWTMLREIAYRFGTRDPTLAEAHMYQEMLTDGGPKVVVAGHLHRAGWWTDVDRKLLYTGCFRDEFAIDKAGNVRAPIPKTYAEVYLSGERTVRSHLVEVDGPPPPAGHVPNSVFEVLARIRPLLPSEEDREQMRLAEIAQVTEEADRRD
jgi:UDP-2,3-diacylglucosamine pyrophosphatase LpxH